MAKKPSKPKLTVTKGKTPSGDMAGSASKGSKSPLAMLGGKKDYKKPGSEAPTDMVPGFGDTGMTGES